MLAPVVSKFPKKPKVCDGPLITIPASMTDYAEPRFAINPLSTERGVAGATPAVRFHAASCSLVRHDARYFTAVAEVEEWIEETPWALVSCRQCNPRQEERRQEERRQEERQEES